MMSETIKHLRDLLEPDEIIEPDSLLFETETTPWASQQDKHPKVVVRPKTVESLSKAVAYLNSTDLDLDVRSQGFGNASSKDVLISTSAFDQFELDLEKKTLLLGAGQPWQSYYDKMDEIAPDWTIVSCRTPCIGIGGSVLHGGYSWLSAQYGCASDPQNLLDAQVVTLTGEVIWASSDPNLMWALRGGGGGWGIVINFVFRVYPAPKDIFCGPILIPRDSVPQVAKGIAEFDARSKDPQVSLFIYAMPQESLPFIGLGGDKDMLVVHAFDSHGEAHAKSEDGFKWALDIPGSVDMTKVMNLKEVASMQKALELAKGRNTSMWWPLAAANLTEAHVLKGFEWYEKARAVGGSISKNIYLLYELRSTTSDHISLGDTAYPRKHGMRHVLLLGTGTDKDAPPEELEYAERLLREGVAGVLGDEEAIKHNVVSNGIEHFHDMRDVYAPHYEKLQLVKRKYDPKNRLKGPISPFDGPKWGER